MRRGEIHLVPFEYSDLRGSKRRPACIVSSDQYNARGRDVILAMITSNMTAREVGDIPVQDWRSAGLLKASVVRSGRLRVLEQRLLTDARGRFHKAISTRSTTR